MFAFFYVVIVIFYIYCCILRFIYSTELIVFQVIWRKTDSSLPITRWTLQTIEYKDNKQKLIIHSADWVHNGTYYCIVKNKLGMEKRNFELIVF